MYSFCYGWFVHAKLEKEIAQVKREKDTGERCNSGETQLRAFCDPYV